MRGETESDLAIFILLKINLTLDEQVNKSAAAVNNLEVLDPLSGKFF